MVVWQKLALILLWQETHTNVILETWDLSFQRAAFPCFHNAVLTYYTLIILKSVCPLSILCTLCLMLDALCIPNASILVILLYLVSCIFHIPSFFLLNLHNTLHMFVYYIIHWAKVKMVNGQWTWNVEMENARNVSYGGWFYRREPRIYLLLLGIIWIKCIRKEREGR